MLDSCAMGIRKPYMAGSIRAIRGVLLEDWDPCYVRDAPEAHDEYDTYVLHIYGMLRDGTSAEQLTDYLHWVETERMGTTVEKKTLKPIGEKLAAIDVSRDEQRQ
jgi:hypothetical protein